MKYLNYIIMLAVVVACLVLVALTSGCVETKTTVKYPVCECMTGNPEQGK